VASSVTVRETETEREGIELNEGLRGCKAEKQKAKRNTLAKAYGTRILF